jgi:arginine decarboxylase
MPDSWAIDQLFPICPIHRLHEEPTRRGILADITCDSDGKIDNFVDKRIDKKALELHELRNGEPYYLGVFLLGAYQEILGDLHNLLGDTHAVHVSYNPAGGSTDGAGGNWSIDEVIEGDTVKEVLGYVQFDDQDMRRAVRRDVERAIKANRVTVAEGKSLMQFYESGLDGYTYLEE